MSTIYQTVGRTALRVEGNTKKVTILVAGFADAQYLSRLFRGCEWLGHIEVPGVPQLPYLAELGMKTTKARQKATGTTRSRGGRPRQTPAQQAAYRQRQADAARKRRASSKTLPSIKEQ